jgi:NAD(P)-dependent dehydrogenase (short-subunit alcohol dehydrogenase family)
MNYVKSLAKQLGPKGIRVNALAPGPIWTAPGKAAVRPRKSYRISEPTPPWGGPASPRSWHRFTFNSPQTTRASLQDKFTVRRVGTGQP